MHDLNRRDAIRITFAAAAGSLLTVRTTSGITQPPAAHADPRFRFANVDGPSGVRLHFAECGETHRPAIICLHGLTDSWLSYRMVMPLLAKSHRVIALDLRGHGESSPPPGEFMFDDCAADVIAVMAHLRIERAAIIGHSMGSFIARRLAVSHPSHVSAMVLVGGALTADNAVVRDLESEVLQLGDHIPREFVEGFQASTVLDRSMLPEWFFNACVDASTRVQPRIWRSALSALIIDQRTSHDVRLGCRTLVIGGECDGAFSAAEQRSLAEAITGSRLLLYRHCGHAPHWEQPSRFVEDVQDFLAAE